ncbi:MAG: aldehyde dehydrogenase family protein [Ignavibacteria bacterium]|nr:aldehyde dehydrogenase family protein [Ignavibacteria bacterium]
METRLAIPKMYKLFIGGKFARTESERYLEVFDADNNKLCNISRSSRKDVRNAVVAARAGFASWNSKTPYERGQIFYRLAEMLESGVGKFVDEIIISTGCTPQQACDEVSVAIDRIIFYAGLCDKYVQLSGTVNPVQAGYFNFSIPEPTGIVGIILPDTLSFLPMISRILPVLASGNSCIILANEKFPLPALSFSEVIATSDFPSGSINILTGSKKELVSHLAGHMDVNAIDYSADGTDYKKLIQELCANNVKRGNYIPAKWDWYNDELNETVKDIEKFTETKTVWHTMGN